MAAKKTSKTGSRSVIVHKSVKPTKDLHEVLGETERTIQELARIFAELPEGKVRGVGGRRILTTKEKLLLNEIGKAQKRADSILEIIKKQ